LSTAQAYTAASGGGWPAGLRRAAVELMLHYFRV